MNKLSKNACRAGMPAQHVQQVPEWTNEQCLDFLAVAFRHAEIKGDIELDDIRLGVKMVNEAAPAPVVVPEGLRIALSNAGIAAPESDEVLWASQQDYIQMLVTWVKDRKPFKPAPVVVPDFKKLSRELVDNLVDCDGADDRAAKQYLEWTEKTLRTAMLAAPPAKEE